MNRRMAALSFLVICLILAFLLVTKTVSPLVGGIVFALTLVGLGVISRGFTSEKASSKK